MSQTTITYFFSTRKRAAAEDIVSSKNKVLILERKAEESIVKHFKVSPLLATPQTGGTLKNVKLLSNKKEVAIQKALEPIIDSVTPTPKLRSKAIAKLSFDGMQPTNIQKPHSKHSELENSVRNSKKCESLPSLKNTAEVPEELTAFMKKHNAANIAKNLKATNGLDGTKAARLALSLGDIKSKLSNSSKLAELKASAARFTHDFQRLKELEVRRSLKEFKHINVEVPISPSKRTKCDDNLQSPRNSTPTKEQVLMSPRKVVVSPVKSPSKVPAYIKHASLATSSTSLPLPHHYRFLGELFRAMETVSSLLFSRKEKNTFAKLKLSVQEMLKRNFTEKHLGQIKYLTPEFYNYELQKIQLFSSNSERFELLITPVLQNNVSIMNPTILLERRRVFYDRLLNKVKEHHANFLSTLDPPMIISDDKLTRWHPEFELEKIPEIECSEIPELSTAEKYSTAQDVLSKARELFSCNTRMERALEKLAQAKARGLTDLEKRAMGLVLNEDSKAAPSLNSQVQIVNPALRNLPPALLEKIKAKQAAKALEAMTRSSEDEKKYWVYSRLPDLARTLRNIFVTERKNVLSLKVVLSKLDSSFKAKVSANELQGDIKVLSQEVPDWLSLHEIRNGTYLKLDRSKNLEEIKGKLEKLADKYKYN